MFGEVKSLIAFWTIGGLAVGFLAGYYANWVQDFLDGGR